ncbi:hypothetical protein B0H11DRAFT_2036841, partial [Mycena galericulata]
MHSTMCLQALTLALASLVIAQAQPQSQVPLAADSPDPQNATVGSLVYGIPLTQYVIFANSIANMSGGAWTTNSILHERTLANSSYRTVVRPNVDTLYSESLIDLSAGELVATMPVVTGRFVLWSFYDVYGNNFCNIGTTSGSRVVNYLLTYRASNPGCIALGSEDQYAGIVYMPTPYASSMIRIEVDNSTDADYVVKSIQPGFALTPGAAHEPVAPRLTRALLNEGLETLATSDIPQYIMELTARVAGYNLPEIEEDVASVQAMLQSAGIDGETLSYSKQDDVDLPLAYATALTQVSAVATAGGFFIAFGNGWSALQPDVSGDFHSHYVVRAYVAIEGYMQLNTTEALYPTYNLTETLSADNTYLVEFYGKPPVTEFWSLTVYDETGFLVPNDLGRYSLNNRGGMEYPNGDLISESPADSPCPFYMLLQSTSHDVSSEWESNWLPTSADGAIFNFLMRMYGPEQSLFNGTYKYPKVTTVAVNPPIPSTTCLV